MSVRPRGEDEPLTIICTGDGQHRRAVLGQYWHMIDGSHRLTSRFGSGSVLGPGDHNPDVPELATISTVSYELYCRRCQRNPRRADMCEQFARAYDTRMMAEWDIRLFDRT